jgi:lysophospholipase L1-like esterase
MRSHMPVRSLKNPRLLALYAAFLTALLVVAVLLVELVVLPGLSWPVPRKIQLMGFHAQPGLDLGATRIHRLGFAGDAPEPEKPPDTLRVLTLGESTLFNRNLTGRLAARLREGGQSFEVLGAALRSHTSRSSVLKYQVLRELDFDVVLICHGINDLYANHVPPEEFRDDYSHLNPWYRRGPLLDRSLIARRLFNAAHGGGLLATSAPEFADQNRAGFASEKTLETNLRQLVERVRADGGQPVLLTLAWSLPGNYTIAAFDKGSLGYNNPEGYDPCPVELWGTPEYVAEGLERHNAVTRRVAAQLQTPLFDAEVVMGRDLVWFGDICHFSEPGTDRFVDLLVRFLAGEFLLRRNVGK